MVFWRVTSVLCIAGLVVGCANLQAVNTTAGQLVSTASSWNSVADEFEASCVRRNQVSEVASNCSSEQQATAGLEAANKILAAYFEALQQASGGTSFSVDSGLSGLSSAVDSIPGVNTTQTKAIGGLATFLTDVATQGLQQRTIERLISGGAPKAVAAIDVLNDVVVPQLTNVFNRESRQTLAAFASYIQQSGTTADLKQANCASGLKTSSFSTGTAYLLAQAYCARITVLATKIAALESYKSSLGTAKTALESMESGKDNLGAKALAQQLAAQASTLKSDIENLNKAF